MEQQGQVVEKEFLMTALWGDTFSAPVGREQLAATTELRVVTVVPLNFRMPPALALLRGFVSLSVMVELMISAPPTALMPPLFELLPVARLPEMVELALVGASRFGRPQLTCR